jgi:hypothetical protein
MHYRTPWKQLSFSLLLQCRPVDDSFQYTPGRSEDPNRRIDAGSPSHDHTNPLVDQNCNYFTSTKLTKPTSTRLTQVCFLLFGLLDRTKTNAIDRATGADTTGFSILRTPKPVGPPTLPDTLMPKYDLPLLLYHRQLPSTHQPRTSQPPTPPICLPVRHASCLPPTTVCPIEYRFTGGQTCQ